MHIDSMELQVLQRKVKALQDKTVDMENRLRRNNLWVVGLPERAERERQTCRVC